MKLTRTEFGHDYSTYRFGYCEYATLEEGDRVEELYAQGFLPYSAEPAVVGKFYRARSARVRLSDFSFSSENRRIIKRFETTLTRKILGRADALADARIPALFLSYFAERHGPQVMPRERLDGIFSSPLPLRVLAYEQHGALVAAVIEVADGSFGHFWFSAYDLSLVEQSLGMWLMLDAAHLAKEEGRSQYYLGTVYGKKALYKTNLTPLDFWDGSGWNSDIHKLKERARGE